MDTRPLGNTGLHISAIVFGAGAVGGAVFTGDLSEREAIVRHALERGINWIDTAPSYGNGQSEENLGRILHALDARPHLSTKVHIAADDLNDIPGAIERSVAQSLERLRRPSVDLIQLHNSVRFERDPASRVLGIDDVLGPGGVVEGLERMRERGLTQLLGFTGLGDPEALLQVIESGRLDAVQAYHNLLNPTASREVSGRFSALDFQRLAVRASERGMGVLNIRVLAAGALGGNVERAGSYALAPGSEPERDLERARIVADTLQDEPGTLVQQALRLALHTPSISGVLVGFSSRAHVDEAVEAAGMPPLSEESLARLDALYARDFAPA